MNRTYSVVTIVSAAAVFLAAPARADEAPDRPAARPTDEERARELARMIKLVSQAEYPSSAAAAYARGNAIDSGNVQLQETYMLRMLEFGLPKVALYPARRLVRLDKDHSMAWSVMGYTHGAKGELPAAFDATIRAVWKMRDNSSALHNAGQLVAWYDHEPDPPPVAAVTRRWLEQMRGELAKNADFARAYEKIAQAYKQRAVLVGAIDNRLPQTERTALTLRRQLSEAESHYRVIMSGIESREQLIRSLTRELYYYHWHDYDPHGVDYHHHLMRREELRARIRDEERIIDVMRQQSYRIRAEAQAALRRLKASERMLDGLNRQREQAVTAVYRRFRWDPPAVNGVVTPEVERFIHPATGRSSPPVEPEVLAARRLKVAELYIRNDLQEEAIELLTEIVAEHGSTVAAEHAKSLLEDMELNE